MLKHLKSSDDWNTKSLSAKGFTLIELLIVIIILGILAGVAIFAINGIDDTANENSCTNELDTVNVAVEAYKTTHPDVAENTITEALLLSDGNLSKEAKYWSVTGGVVSRDSTTFDDVPEADCDN